MYVYFVATKGCNPKMVKIGKAKNVDSRLAEIQCYCPYELELRGTLKCTSEKHAFAVENSLHHTFRDYRRRGEWFLYTLETKYAIDSIVKDGLTTNFNSHLFRARVNRAPLEHEETEVDQLHNAMDREFRAIVG